MSALKVLLRRDLAQTPGHAISNPGLLLRATVTESGSTTTAVLVVVTVDDSCSWLGASRENRSNVSFRKLLHCKIQAFVQQQEWFGGSYYGHPEDNCSWLGAGGENMPTSAPLASRLQDIIQPIGGKGADPQLRLVMRAIETETGSSTGAILVAVTIAIPIRAACGLVNVERTY